MTKPNYILRPWEQSGIVFFRAVLTDNVRYISIYGATYGSSGFAWCITGKVKRFPTKEKAMKAADSLCIENGHKLIDDEETLQKYLLLL